jgi:glycosyltransferase involved in cell wall biosynthesis
MAAALERLLADAALSARLAAAALTAVPAYSWDRRAERLEGFLASMGVASR